MKILFILEYYHPHIGGVETLFKSLIQSLDRAGNEITILTNQYDKTLPQLEKKGRVSIKRLPLRNRYLFTFLSVFAAIKLARNHDLIHTTSYNAAVPAYFASKLTGTKAIITFHEVWGKLWFQLPWLSLPSKILHYTFEQLILKLNFHRFIPVSDYTKNALIMNGINPEVITRIYNGIDYTEFQKKTSDSKLEQPTFIYFGRIGVSKGIDVLLQAIEFLQNENDNFILKMIIPKKDDGLTKKVRSIIKKRGLSKRINLLRSMPFDNLKQTISESTAVIIPSYSEGFCFAAVETIALGIPIISSGQGALKEVISGKYLQFQNMDSMSLKESMIKAINDDWDILPEKKFALSDSVAQYLALYTDLSTQ